jgi:hypothetical protein
MLEQTSNEFRAKFLLKFTKELIENTKAYNAFKIEEKLIIEKKETEALKEIKKEEIIEFVKEKITKESEKISELEKDSLLSELKKSLNSKESARRQVKKRLAWKIPSAVRIPETALPETVSYLKPIPTSEEIDLGKLNILVRDPLVKVMECNAPGQNVIVIGIMGRKKTPIILNKEEIEDVLQRFSQAAKIPVHEGLFKAAYGSLVISAVISEIVGIQFIIRKISQEIQ